MKLNPRAILVWGISASIGYLIGGFNGALMGFILSGCLSLLTSDP